MERKIWEISWSSLWRVFIFVLIVAALFLARKVLIVLGISIIVSSALDPFVSFLEKKKIPRLLGTLLAFLLAVIVLSAVLYVVVPIVVFELRSFVFKFDEIMSSIFGLNIPSQILDKFVLNFDRALSFFTSNDSSLWDVASSVFGGLVLTLATIIISFYFTIERHGVENFIKTIVPDAYEEQVIQILSAARRKIGRWFLGQMLLSLIVGVATGIGLWLLGIKYSLVLGILAGLLEIVPIVGPVFAGVVALLVALGGASPSLLLALYVVILFIAIQQLESHLVIPLVMSRAVGSHPVVILIAILAGGTLAGFIGILLAVPATIVLQQVFDNLAKRKVSRRNASLAFAPYADPKEANEKEEPK